MSSEATTMARVLSAGLALGLAGCAGFTRGERWEDDDEDTSGASATTTATPPADGGDDDDDGDPSGGSTPGSTSDAPETEGPPDAPSFAVDVLPLLLAGCERCHSPDGQANTTGLIYTDDVDASYASTLDFVDTATPSKSRLLSKSAGQGHIGGTIYDRNSAEYAAILDWIAQGANP